MPPPTDGIEDTDVPHDEPERDATQTRYGAPRGGSASNVTFPPERDTAAISTSEPEPTSHALSDLCSSHVTSTVSLSVATHVGVTVMPLPAVHATCPAMVAVVVAWSVVIEMVTAHGAPSSGTSVTDAMGTVTESEDASPVSVAGDATSSLPSTTTDDTVTVFPPRDMSVA